MDDNTRVNWLMRILVVVTAAVFAGCSGSYGEVDVPTEERTEPVASAGCGLSASSGWREIEVEGYERDYRVQLPTGYNKNLAYPIVIVGHARSGSAAGVHSSGYNGLRSKMPGTIFVAPQALEETVRPDEHSEAGMYAWRHHDVLFMSEMLDALEAQLCIDTDRAFITGISFGGNLAHMVACELGDRFAGAASVIGRIIDSAECNWDVPVPMLMINGLTDTQIGTDRQEAATAAWVAGNACEATTHSDSLHSGCESYDGCDAAVTVCEHSGGHSSPSWADDAIEDFFEAL